MDWKLQLFRLNYDDAEERVAARIVRDGWLTMGPQTMEFEDRFGQMMGSPACAVAVSSGTASLHMALLALGVGAGDEVIVSALTFIADVNVVMLVGAKPVLADCTSASDWNIDPNDVERKITSKTRAVIAVHYAGYPCRLDQLRELCNQRGLALVEDAAHAVGATFQKRQCGTFGDVGCFSFFSNKNLSVGEGGMFVSTTEELVQKAKLLRSHGMSSLSFDRHSGRATTYDVSIPGLNYRTDEIRSALGIEQLRKLPAGNTARARITSWYDERLAEIPRIQLPFLAQRSQEASFHIYPTLLDADIDRNAVIAGLKEHGIQSSIHYPAINGFSAFAGHPLGSTSRADEISARELTLPLYPTMTVEDVELAVDALRAALV